MYLIIIISIRSHSHEWAWRDWQPLYRVGCEVLVCLCKCVGLLRSLLLDRYLGSQKLREIITLLCCITLSSSREKPMHAQEVAGLRSWGCSWPRYTTPRTRRDTPCILDDPGVGVCLDCGQSAPYQNFGHDPKIGLCLDGCHFFWHANEL